MKTNVNNTTANDANERRNAPEFLTAQKFANVAARELSEQLAIDENDAAYYLSTIAADGRRIFAVTHGRAETLRTHARHAADRIAEALTIDAGAAADLLCEVLTYWHNNLMVRADIDDETGDQMTDEAPAAPAAAKVARAAAAKVATAAAALLLTFATSPAGDLTTYHTTSTADALAVLSQLTAQGLPLYHVTIKTA